jgi:hypothetical protein
MVDAAVLDTNAGYCTGFVRPYFLLCAGMRLAILLEMTSLLSTTAILSLKSLVLSNEHAVVIQSNMRQLGRLMQHVNSDIVGLPISLSTAIDSLHFDKLLQATELM